jgi:superfamily II DNA or RNA helicase
MAKAKKPDKDATYYQKFGDALKRQIREYHARRVEAADLFSGQETSLFELVESGVTKHRLRYYQMEALYVLDYLLNLSPNKQEKKSLIEKIDQENNIIAPFFGFEMATGSGKTMLMGASIFYIFKKFGIKNFLIITPASTDVYQKTKLNFARGTFESVWANDTPFTYNLVTGDDYTATPLYDGFNSTRDLSIFVFNISKFGTNAVNTTKSWEASIWKDESGNTIGIRDYLQKEKLVIITDEAHHAQNTASSKIIKSFHPEAVLEFTATAVESSNKDAKKAQTIVYKYDIRRFLEDGYGKTVKAIALNIDEVDKQKKKRTDIAQGERLKLITLGLIHLLKKKAVLKDERIKGLKPIAFVKVKEDTPYAEKAFNYIKGELHQDEENLQIVLGKLKAQELEITDLLQQMFEEDYGSDWRKLAKELEKVTRTAIFYHGKSDKETGKKWNNIRRNEVEIIVYMQKLDEGIDLPNIYSMAVVNDTETEFKTAVKQIIGRGVRLGKEKREFDESGDKLLAQTEKLHVVCDQGKNFEDVILQIQKEFGLTDKYLSSESKRTKVINRTKSDRLEGLFLPEIKADFKARSEVKLMDLARDVETVVDEYIKYNCLSKNNAQGDEEIDDIPPGIFLKFTPGAFFVEVDVFADHKVFHQQMRGNFHDEVLELNESHAKGIYASVMKHLYCLPDNKESKDIFKKYIERFQELGMRYYYSDDADKKLAQSKFVSMFAAFYRSYIEKNYFELDFKSIVNEDSQSLKQRFTDVEILIAADQEKNTSWKRINDPKKIKQYIEQGYQFFGYKDSIYDYVKFDTFTEKQFADYAEQVLSRNGNGRPPFWIRNNRNVWFSYGTRRYYPDFLMLKDGIIYVLETKGEIYSDTRKNLLLSKLDTVQGYSGVLIFSDFMDKVRADMPFAEFLKQAELDAEQRQGKERLVKTEDVAEEDKYVRYLPAYKPESAYRKFIKQQTKVRIEGWLQVPTREGNYDEGLFVVQMKGAALSPELPHNQWAIFRTNCTLEEAVGKVVLIQHPGIQDANLGASGITIRRFEYEKKKAPGTLFDTVTVVLSSNSDEFQELNLQSIFEEGEIKIIGLMIAPVWEPATVIAFPRHNSVDDRGAIFSYIVNSQWQQPTFGHVKCAKLIYWVLTHVGVDLGGEQKREAAGPLADFFFPIEKTAEERGWFYVQKRSSEGYSYHPGPNISERVQAAIEILADRKEKLDKLLELLAGVASNQIEAAATLFAVWNDFLIEGHQPTDNEIIREALENWHPEKRLKLFFNLPTLKVILKWMREIKLTPEGIGPRTIKKV